MPGGPGYVSNGTRTPNSTRTTTTDEFPDLVSQASQAAFWNASLLPLVAIFNLAFAVIVRQKFGLFSGVYDIVLGLSSAFILYSSVGIPVSLTKFLPEIESSRGTVALLRFLRHASVFRLLVLVLVLVPFNILAIPIAERLDLGADGATYLRLLSVLVVARAVLDLVSKVLNTFFAQLWVNLMALTQSALNFGLVNLALLLGYGMSGVMGALMVSSLVLSLIGASYTPYLLRRASNQPPKSVVVGSSKSDGLLVGEGNRFFRFASFSYVFEISLFFSGMGFAGPALAVVLNREQVALFAVGFKFALMTVVVVVAAFRGLYRPLFARVRIRDNPSQLQRAFIAVTKIQILLLVPAGVGLVIMSADYVPLLFGLEFQPAVPIAQVLVCLMYAETVFGLGVIVLSVDERYLRVFWTQSVLILLVPFFLFGAANYGVFMAAVVFGSARLGAALLGYLFCRRDYGFRFPWTFACRVGLVSLVMGSVLVVAQSWWTRSVIEAITLTFAGIVIFGFGLRIAKVMGPDETELLRRGQLPGHRWILNWLVPSGQSVSAKWVS